MMLSIVFERSRSFAKISADLRRKHYYISFTKYATHEIAVFGVNSVK